MTADWNGPEASLRRRLVRTALVCLLVSAAAADNATAQSSAGFALRFNGTGSNDVDRVKIRIDGPATPADVGATDFTLEFWMRALPGENSSAPIGGAGDSWMFGNVIVDRDVFSGGDFGDFGISIAGGRVAFGANRSGTANTIVGSIVVTDGLWHHLAVTRRMADGWLRIFVDGALDVEGPGPAGDLSYRDNRPPTFPNDPFLVLGAAKHDAGPTFPSFRGWMDELRLSSMIRYPQSFVRPTAPFVADPATVALYDFNQGSGAQLTDTSGAAGGPSHGVIRFGGTPAGPVWVVSDVPFNRPPAVEAGVNQTISLPASAVLDGTVTDDGLPNPPATITASWTLVSGTGQVTFGNSAAVDTTAGFSTAGTYVLRLTASDSALSAFDEVTITVAPANQPPLVAAGPDQSITQPAFAVLSGAATDDGLPTPPGGLTTLWTPISGPGMVTFGNAGRLTTTATFSTIGTYVLRLTAGDGALSAFDEISIQVSPAPPLNQPPTVTAGPDLLVMAVLRAALDGRAVDDGLPNPPGSVTTLWSMVIGPGTVSFANATAAATIADFTAPGTYTLRLTAGDGALSSFDDVTIRIVATNTPPVVTAGDDRTITLPATAALTGTVDDDGFPDPPAAVTTTWTALGGPGTVVFANAAALATTATFSSGGTYILRLTASDGGLITFDDVTITVNAGNLAPVVDAGRDRTISEQLAVVNPNLVEFVSPDHDRIRPDGQNVITNYFLEIWSRGVNPSTGQPVQIHDLGKPPAVPGTDRVVIDRGQTFLAMAIGEGFVATVRAVGPGGDARSGISNPFVRRTEPTPPPESLAGASALLTGSIIDDGFPAPARSDGALEPGQWTWNGDVREPGVDRHGSDLLRPGHIRAPAHGQRRRAQRERRPHGHRDAAQSAAPGERRRRPDGHATLPCDARRSRHRRRAAESLQVASPRSGRMSAGQASSRSAIRKRSGRPRVSRKSERTCCASARPTVIPGLSTTSRSPLSIGRPSSARVSPRRLRCRSARSWTAP